MHLTPSWILSFAGALGKVSGFVLRMKENLFVSYFMLKQNKLVEGKKSRLGTKMLALIQEVMPQ